MKRLLAFTILIAFILSVITGCTDAKEQGAHIQPEAEPVDLTISAAASLKDAAEELKELYAKEHPHVNITYNFAASGTLQKQIEEGAPVDLFISAGKKQMDALEEKDLLVKESRMDLLGNSLVLIAQKDSNISGFEDLSKPEIERISIGTPESVPAGQYAKDALTSMELWDELQPKLVLAKDARQVLTYVKTGNVAAGLVYKSDALTGQNIKVVAAAPADSHKPIVYPMAVIKGTQQREAAEEFAAYLSDEEAAGVFAKHGFATIKK